MCSGKNVFEPSSPAKSCRGREDPPGARSPYQYQLSRPKLSRSIAPGVKINLNRYWSKFGEMMSPITRPAASFGRKLSEERIRQTSAMGQKDVADACDRRTVQHRFEVLGGSLEADENLINEIREICSTSTINQYLNCKCF